MKPSLTPLSGQEKRYQIQYGEDHKHPLFYYVPDTDSLKIESVYPFDVDGEDYTDDEPDEDKEKCKGYVAEPRTSSDY